MKYKRILCIPDLQAPYHHPEALRFLAHVKKEINPDLVMCLGDELDQYTLSKYASSPDADSPALEYAKAMRIMARLYELFPEAKAVTSNHVDRIFKKAAESGIPSAYLKSIPEFMQAPKGWEWRDFWVVDGIRFEHGERAGGLSGLRNLVLANMRKTVIGHQHECPGTTYVSNGEATLWGLNVGCLVSQDSFGLAYTKKNRHKPVLGCGIIIDGIPTFFPMEGYR
jgi:hypothetical protein